MDQLQTTLRNTISAVSGAALANYGRDYSPQQWRELLRAVEGLGFALADLVGGIQLREMYSEGKVVARTTPPGSGEVVSQLRELGRTARGPRRP